MEHTAKCDPHYVLHAEHAVAASLTSLELLHLHRPVLGEINAHLMTAPSAPGYNGVNNISCACDIYASNGHVISCLSLSLSVSQFARSCITKQTRARVERMLMSIMR